MIWDHGSGLDGISWDDTSGSHITIPQLGTAIDNTGVHFGFIGFDACLMSMTEIAYDLGIGGSGQGYADFVIGSQDLEPASGWAYVKWLQGIATSGSVVTPADLATGAVNTFAAAYPKPKGIALSGVETAEMPALISALNDFTHSVLSDAGTKIVGDATFQKITSAAQGSLEFGGGLPPVPKTPS